MKIRFVLNGMPVSADVATGDTAVEVLRREFGMFSVRQTCGQGICGACTILVGGNPASACLMLAPRLGGEEIETVEGLSDDPGQLHPLQEAFCAEGAVQCGYCTPGMVLMAKTLLRDHPHPDEGTIRTYMSGNICRCCSYPEIVRAIQCAAKS
jgi:aerobic-type carbon monoxide dehydrogenase small subunit (CoxS/CutS family)